MGSEMSLVLGDVALWPQSVCWEHDDVLCQKKEASCFPVHGSLGRSLKISEKGPCSSGKPSEKRGHHFLPCTPTATKMATC